MNFIKKNIVFTIVVVVTLIGAFYLIYLDWTLHESISDANETTRKNQEDFENAFKKGNKPVELNIKMIKDDAEELKKRTVRLQRIFGYPYRKALLKFAAGLKVSEDELLERMKKLYNDDNEKGKTAKELIQKLFAGLAKDKKISNADIMEEYNKFISSVQKETVEDIPTLESDVGYDILGEALGLSRTMNPSKAQEYLGQMQRNIWDRRLIPGVKKRETVVNFTFDQFIQRSPAPVEVDDILNTMPIYEDIFRRMNESRLESVVAFKRVGQPKKFAGDKYISYEFSTTVIGSIDSVRNFMNKLLDAAYKDMDNRVYVITWVSLTSPDSAAEEETVRKQLSEGSDSNASAQKPSSRERRGGPQPQNRQRSGGNQQRIGRKRGDISEMEAEMQPDYGSVLIGKSRNINAVLRFKYYRYLGERLKK